MKSFRRVLRLADIAHGSRVLPVVVTVKWTHGANLAGGRLSFSGVEGPKRNGDALGSCGQITIPAAHHINRAPCYDRIGELWARWHLNDMRDGCEHQRAAWDVSEILEVVTYRLTAEARKIRREATRRAIVAAQGVEVANLTDMERALLGVKEYATTKSAPDADDLLSGCWEVSKRETKCAGWVDPTEHPRGLLTKPCDECGYRYGTAWLCEEVPASVLEELAALEDTGTLPGVWAQE